MAPPVYVTPANIHTNLILQKSRLIDLHFIADSLRLASFNFFLVSSVRRFYFGIIGEGTFRPFKGIQGHWYWCQSKAQIWLPISP